MVQNHEHGLLIENNLLNLIYYKSIEIFVIMKLNLIFIFLKYGVFHLSFMFLKIKDDMIEFQEYELILMVLQLILLYIAWIIIIKLQDNMQFQRRQKQI